MGTCTWEKRTNRGKLFDTGSSRNSVGTDFLKELARHPRLLANVLCLWDIDPFPCVGMEA